MTRRIVVTSTGMITPIGNTAEETFGAAIEGKTAFSRPEHLKEAKWGGKATPVTVAGALNGFDLTKYMLPKEARRTDPFIVYSISSAQQAWTTAGFPERLDNEMGDKFGTLFGVGLNGVSHILDTEDLLESRGPRRVSPFFIPAVIGNLSAGHVGMRFNLRGPNWTPSAAGASGAFAVGESLTHIRDGRCDRMLAGGAESAIHAMVVAAYINGGMHTTNDDDDQTPVRAFDKSRSGTVIGEGAAALILEEADAAQGRGAKALCDLAGFAAQQSNDLHWDPNAESMAQTMRLALEDAGLSPEDIDYVNPHGVGTVKGDEAEAKAIEEVFGAHAKNLHISSTKSLTGHMIGAAGAVEAAICAHTIHSGSLPVSAGLTDPAFDLPFVTAPKTAEVRAAMSMNFGLGGTHTALVMKRVG